MSSVEHAADHSDEAASFGAYSCPRFAACNAPICPFIASSFSTGHQRGDAICPYLLEAVKPGGKGRLACFLSEQQVRAVVSSLPTVIALGGDMARALKRASEQGSRIDAAGKARAARELKRVWAVVQKRKREEE